MGMLYGALAIDGRVFRAVTLDRGSGGLVEARPPARREALAGWLAAWDGRPVAVEASCGRRWVARGLRAAADGLEARRPAGPAAKQMLPASRLPPEDSQRLRDPTRLRQAPRHDRGRRARRPHAILPHAGRPCSRSRPPTPTGLRRLAALPLEQHPPRLVAAHPGMIGVSGERDRRDRPRAAPARPPRPAAARPTNDPRRRAGARRSPARRDR